MNDIAAKLDDLRIERPPDHSGTPWRWLLAALLLVAVGGTAAFLLTRDSAAVVGTATAREIAAGGERTVLNASGYVTARRQATVSSKVTGKVVDVLIEEGMEVEEGQMLATLDDTNVRAAYLLNLAQLEAARTELEETRVRRREAQLDLERVRRLAEGGFATAAELDRATADVDSLAARLDSQRQAVVVAEKAAEVARRTLEDTVIRAPFAGIVVAKNAQPGEMISPVSAGGGFTRTGIGTIVDMSSLEIEVEVNEAYINRVVPGQRVEATLDAYPDWTIPAEVIAIIPTADRETATVEVRVGFDELDPRILPDMGVKVAFQGVEAERGGAGTAVVVPRRAIRSDGGADIVLVVADGVVERRAVRVGETTADGTVVLAGLAGGEKVVVDGPAELADGDPVEERG